MEVKGLKNGIVYSRLLSQYPEIIHGVSTKIFGPLIFNRGKKDEVIKNRKEFFGRLGIDLHDVVMMEQMHSINIKIINRRYQGSGVFDISTYIPNTDGLITDKPGIFLAVLSADCVPLLFFDPVRNVVAVAHAGWQGTLKLIGKKMVEKLERKFNTNPKDLVVYIGPSIGPCCYDINPRGEKRIEEIKKKFKDIALFKEEDILKKRGKKVYLDFWEANKIQLLKSGVQNKNIDLPKICTACNLDYFPSHHIERDSRIHTMISVIGMKG